jgi:hypothetical protein
MAVCGEELPEEGDDMADRMMKPAVQQLVLYHLQIKIKTTSVITVSWHAVNVLSK